MSWPLKLRVTSFAIGMVVVLGEVALVAIPIGVIVWLMGAASAITVIETVAAIAFATALVVIVPVHVRPTRMEPVARNGGSV
jgi:hypothetical protein